MRPHRTIASFLVISLICPTLFAGLGSTKAEYTGGTWSYKQGTEGKLDTSDEKRARFYPDHHGNPEDIIYSRITSLEYGQKAGRRVGATIAWGVTTLGVMALPMLLSKKRKHYLSIGFTGEDGKPQGIVMELGKNVTRGTLMTFETRSGKKMEYESEEAKKHVGN